jgi:hypothetical protein
MNQSSCTKMSTFGEKGERECTTRMTRNDQVEQNICDDAKNGHAIRCHGLMIPLECPRYTRLTSKSRDEWHCRSRDFSRPIAKDKTPTTCQSHQLDNGHKGLLCSLLYNLIFSPLNRSSAKIHRIIYLPSEESSFACTRAYLRGSTPSK